MKASVNHTVCAERRIIFFCGWNYPSRERQIAQDIQNCLWSDYFQTAAQSEASMITSHRLAHPSAYRGDMLSSLSQSRSLCPKYNMMDCWVSDPRFATNAHDLFTHHSKTDAHDRRPGWLFPICHACVPFLFVFLFLEPWHRSIRCYPI